MQEFNDSPVVKHQPGGVDFLFGGWTAHPHIVTFHRKQDKAREHANTANYRACFGETTYDTLPLMEHHVEFVKFIRDLMPDATDEERHMAAERLDDYIRLLMRMSERLEAEEDARIRGSGNRAVS